MISVKSQVLLTLIIVSGCKAQLSFTLPPLGGYTIAIAENTPPASSLYTLQADNPSGLMPVISLASALCVSTNTPSPNFSINNLDQLVVPAEGLDAENCTQFTLTFTATAGGNSINSSLLMLNVTDVNDVDPIFQNLPYTGQVWKNDIQGQTVNESLLIRATDGDVVKLPITISIAGAQTTFAINSSTGTVYVNTPSGLAALASPTTLTIQASDGSRTSSVALVITVHDSPCLSLPCQNGGTCNEIRNTSTCVCLSGYTGSKCENVDYCLVNHCQNNATCNSMDNGYKCSCKYPYLCDESTTINNCSCRADWCNPNPCLNGGTCLNGPDGYKCTCPIWFFGKRCENTDPYLPIGIGCPCVAVICIVVANVVFWRKQRMVKECHCDRGK